jgi:hypothetical protein
MIWKPAARNSLLSCSKFITSVLQGWTCSICSSVCISQVKLMLTFSALYLAFKVSVCEYVLEEKVLESQTWLVQQLWKSSESVWIISLSTAYHSLLYDRKFRKGNHVQKLHKKFISKIFLYQFCEIILMFKETNGYSKHWTFLKNCCFKSDSPRIFLVES